jgi:hypothetical protein
MLVEDKLLVEQSIKNSSKVYATLKLPEIILGLEKKDFKETEKEKQRIMKEELN